MTDKNIPPAHFHLHPEVAPESVLIEHVPGDPAAAVEELLETHTLYFSAIEDLWDIVGVKAAAAVESGEIPRLPGVIVDDSGVMQPALHSVQDYGNRELRRNAPTINMRQYLGTINRQAFKRAHQMSIPIDMMYRHHYHTPALIRYSAERQAREINDICRAHLKEPAIAIRNTEDFTEASHALEDAYLSALIGQKYGAKRLEEWLASDVYAEPLLTRLKDLMRDGQDGTREYPGLLEVVANYVASTPEKTTNQIQQAMQRRAARTYSEADFVAEVLSGETTVSGDKKMREVMPYIAGAQMMAQLVSVEFADQDLTSEQIIQRVSRHFNLLPEVWRDMYKTALHSRSVRDYDEFAELCKPYGKRGRRLAHIRMGGGKESTRSSSQKRGANRKLAVDRIAEDSTKPSLDVHDISEEQQHAPLGFAVLKSINGSDRFYSTEVIRTETIMDHPIVRKFVDEYPDMAEGIAAHLTHLSENPYDHMNTRRMSIRLTIQGSSTNNARLMRYRPAQNVGDVSGNKLMDRVRIKYTVAEVNGKKRIVLEGISIRDDNTY